MPTTKKDIIKKAAFVTLLSLAAFIQFHELLAISSNANNAAAQRLSVSRQDTPDGDDLKSTRIMKVPAEFPTIAQAVKDAEDGAWIIISPGEYHEKEIEINSAVTISSEWKLTGNMQKIDETKIDSGDKNLFIIKADGVEISGLHILNGDHTLNISSNVTIMYNHFINNLDAMSFEGPSGGYVGYNTVENDRDDGLDIDIGSDPDNIGSNIVVEHNTIINSHDDGMEIRLFSHPDQNIHYNIRENIIIGSKNAGIQLISYDTFTGKVFQLHHNLIRGCKTGLGCMEGSNTVEDLSGASKMDERVYFFNNTLIENQMGATGGNNIVAVNNVVQGNALGGFKRFGRNSVIVNNLFYRNGGDDFVQMNEAVTKDGNIFSVDPLLDRTTFMPAINSPCIDAGKKEYSLKGVSVLEIPVKYVTGSAPDIGAIEFNANQEINSQKQNLIVDAGEDVVLESPANELVLQGKIISNSERSFNAYWKLDKGPGTVNIINPDQLQTKVVFHQKGIYQFSFVCSDDRQPASDTKTIRYIHDGTGEKLFLNEENTNIVEAEDYAYSYGNVSFMGPESPQNKYVKTERGDAGQKTFIEYSVGTSKNADMVIWLLMKNQNSGKSAIEVKFNNTASGRLSVSDRKKWNWIKVSGKISMTAGQWPLLIINEEGSVLIDKILFSFDEKFIPKQVK